MMNLSAIAGRCGAHALVLGCVLGCAARPDAARSAEVIFRVLPAQSELIELDRSDCTQPIGDPWEWQRVDENGRATNDPRITTRIEATTLHGAQLTANDISGDRKFLAFGANGGVALCAVDSPNDHVRTFFAPPLAIHFPRSASSDVSRSACTMRVDWIDGRGERDSGSGERSVRTAGNARVMTSQGAFDTLVVESCFEATLRLAKVRRVVTTWTARDVGCIAQKWDERVTVLGVVISRDCGMVVRVSPICATPAPPLP